MENKSISHGLTRSIWGVKLTIPILGVIGLGISTYITYIHYRNINSICLFGANCDAVLTSSYAQIWGIPLALFGLLMYTGLTVLGIINLIQILERQDLIAIGIYGLALSGTLFSIYLYYLEVFEIHAFCTWCIASSLVMFSLLGISLVNLRDSGFIRREFRRWLSQYIKW